MKKIDRVVNEIFGLYETRGHEDYIGEPVSQLEHMSQSAALAYGAGASDEVVLAAFFHDIGHILPAEFHQGSMNGLGAKTHEKTGADFLRSKGFPEQVAQLVENHVTAKRYLTCMFPDYFDRLSEASKNTLAFQGGVMNEQEALRFQQDPLFKQSLELRHWDDLAKITNIPVRNLEMLKSLTKKILTR